MSKIILSAIFFLIFTKSIFADHLYDKESYQLGSIEERCIKALEFYLTRPDLETEFHRRLEFCINTVKDLSPKGFTTNPSLMRKAGIKDYKSFAKEILREINDKPISFEVFSDEIQEMKKQAEEIATWGSNVNVKIPRFKVLHCLSLKCNVFTFL